MNRCIYLRNDVRSLFFSPASLRGLLPLLFSGLLALSVQAKVTNSVASGDWSSAATWDNGVPADGDQISIAAAHSVTLTAAVNFTNAASTLTIDGALDMGTFICRVTTTTVNAGAKVTQQTTSGAAVAANLRATTLSLSPTSTYIYTGNQTGFLGLHPNYGHLYYASSAAASGVFELNLKVGGDLTINNSGSGEIRFGNAVAHSHIIAGSLIVMAGNAVGANGTVNILIDINGNLVIDPGATFKGCNSTGNLTINLAGNLVRNGSLSSPGAGTFRIVFDGNANAAISGAAVVALPNATIDKTGGANVALSQHLNIGKNLNFIGGKLRLGNFNLTMAALATITGATSANYVETTGIGKLIFDKTDPGATFPVGNGSYTPLVMALSASPTGPTAYGVRVVNGFQAELAGCTGYVTDDAVKKMWIITLEQGSATIQNLNLQWNGSDEGTTFNRNVCGVVQYLNNNWETPVPNNAGGVDPYNRGRLFTTLTGGTFGVLDTSAVVNISAPNATSNSPLCVGQTLQLTRTSANVNGANYQWSKQGGGFNPPAGPNATRPNIQPGDAGNYLLTLSKYGCNFTGTAVPVVVHPLPACSITGPTEVCANTAGHGYQGAANMTAYSWGISGNGTITGPTVGPNVSVSAGAPGTYTLSLTVTDGNGCTNSCTQEVTVLARPTGALSGTTTICAGQSATLSIAVTGAGPWSGTLSDGTPFSGNSNPISINVTPSGTTTYTISTLSDSKCTATPNDLSGSATVTIDVLQIFQMTGGGAYCAGGPGVAVGLSGSENGVNYQLKVNGNNTGSPVPGTGSALSFGNQTAAGAYTVLATRSSTGCTATMGGSVAVTVNPLPMVSLTLGIDQALANVTSVPLSGGNPPGGSYSGPGVTGATINPMAAGLGAHVITYTYTDNNGCSGSATDTFTVSPVPGLNLMLESPDSAACGENFIVDIIAAAGFTNLGTVQFSVAWDPNVLMNTGIEPQKLDNSDPLTGFVNDTLIYSWLDTSAAYGATLPNGTLLLRLRFKPQSCSASGSVSIENSPRVIEASDGAYSVVPVTILGTSNVTIYDTEPPVFANVPMDMSVECDNVPDPGSPTATDNCDPMVAVVYEGETTTPGNCPNNYTIKRTWRATDSCNNSTTAAQMIEVKDTTPPTFTRPPDITIYVDGNCEYDAAPAITGDVTNEMDNCTPAQNLNATYTDVPSVLAGTQLIIVRTWTLSDACGNQASSQVQQIVVRDNIPPVLNCPDDMTVSASGGDCTFIVPATGFDPAASDNCGLSDTSYVLTGVSTGSGNGYAAGAILLTGETTIYYTVTDVNGLTASCSFTVTVDECVGITGKLIWEGDDVSGVALAMVNMTGTTSGSYGPTVADGLYTLNGSGNITITPVKTTPPADPLNGVTAMDALILLNHLQGTVLITDPYKLIAADIDTNNVLDGNDWAHIRRAVLGSPYALAFFIAKPWRFVPSPDPGPGFPGYAPPANPFSAPIPDSRVLTGVAGALGNQNFIGMKLGDLDASANPLLKPEGGQTPLVFLTPDQRLEAGQELLVRIRVSHFDELAGYQWAMQFDTDQLEWLGLDSGNSPLNLQADENFGLYQLANGEIRSLWLDNAGKTLPEGTPIFALRFRARQSGALLSDVLRLQNKALEPEAYTMNRATAGLQLVFTEAQTTGLNDPASAAGVQLWQNRPNPFSDETAIGFVLPESCAAQLRIYDAAGRELLRRSKTYPAGYSEETIRLDGAAATGILYYELDTPFGQLTRRMVMMRR